MWQKVLNFLEKKSDFVAAFMLFIMFFLAVTSMYQKNITMDESVHLSAGFSYLVTDDRRMNPEHPHLVKMLSGVPLLFLDVDAPTDSDTWKNNDQWGFGREFIFHNTEDPDVITFWGRFPNVLLMILLGIYIYKWSKELFGAKASLLSLFFYILSSNIIAHSRLVTTDTGVTCFFFIAVYYLGKFLKSIKENQPKINSWDKFSPLLYLSLSFAIAQLAKFSSAFLIPVYIVLILIFEWQEGTFASHQNNFLSKIEGFFKGIFKAIARYYKPAIFLCIFTLFLIWAFYGFEAKTLFSDQETRENIELIVKRDSFFGKAVFAFSEKVPIPAFHFWKGLIMVAAHNKYGHDSYLAGDYRTLGWWYYFPVAFLVKTPLSTMILLLASVLVFYKRTYWKLRALFKETGPIGDLIHFLRGINFSDYLLIIPPVIYFAISLNSKINLGLRHVLPIYPFIFVFLGQLANIQVKQKTLFRFCFGIVLIGYFVSTLAIYPDYLAYFNEAVGGPDNGYKYLVDSNLDWGQDLRGLSLWLEKYGFKYTEDVYVRYYGRAELEHYIPYAKSVPTDKEIEENGVPSGVVAISITNLLSKKREYSWLLRYKPIDKIGYSIWVYYF